MKTANVRERLFRTALKAFAEHGYAEVSVDEIVKAARSTKPMLYYYFGNKEELYEAVVERVFGQIMERARLSGALDPQAGFESLAGFIEGYATVIDAHPAFVRLVLRGVLDHGDVVYDKLLPRIAQVVPFVAGKIAKAQADGLLNPALEPAMVPPALIAPIIFFSIAHPLLSQVTGIPVAELKERWRDHLRSLSMLGLVARKEAP